MRRWILFSDIEVLRILMYDNNLLGVFMKDELKKKIIKADSSQNL